MNVHIGYKVHKTPDIEKEILHQTEKLSKRLQVFRPELVHLKGSLEDTPGREGTAVSLNLRLPSGQLSVQKSASTANTATKAAFDDLLHQLVRHKEMLRSAHKWSRRRREPGARPESRVPFEQTVAAVRVPAVSADDIRSYVNGNLRRLERYIERALYCRQNADQLPKDSVTTLEVVDEVIVRALDDTDKPDKLALEPWLYRLAQRSLDDLANGSWELASSVHLEDSTRTPNVKASDEAELQFHQPDEVMLEENVIPDRRIATPEQAAYSDEVFKLVEAAMSGMQLPQREAFLLYGVEGFSVEETAAILDLPPEDVRLCIANAREHVRKFPSLAHEFRQHPLPRPGAA
jgi:RNA polymerase sigma factor (sigma-70 family)